MENSNNTGGSLLTESAAIIAGLGCFLYVCGVAVPTVISIVTTLGAAVFGLVTALVALAILVHILR